MYSIGNFLKTPVDNYLLRGAKLRWKEEHAAMIQELTAHLWRLLGIVCLLSMSPASAKEQQRPLHVGVIEYFPLVSFESNKPKGPLIQYVQGFLKNLDQPLNFEDVSINRALVQLKSKQLDVVLTLFKDSQRETQIAFSKYPLLSVSAGFCMLKNRHESPLRSSSVMAHVQGTPIPKEIRGLQLLAVSGGKVQLRMLQMLQKGRVAAIYSPKPEILILANVQARMGLNLICYEIRNTRQAIYLGYAKGLPQAITGRIDEALHQKLLEEDFDSFLRRHLQETGLAHPNIEIIPPELMPAPVAP